ncbi:MAG: DUF4167 domain-containing protein [Alphaproteobacteria bacterium]|nr:DUF4167 domain-containing protein [Alphaproteobacteria bacterium]
MENNNNEAVTAQPKPAASENTSASQHSPRHKRQFRKGGQHNGGQQQSGSQSPRSEHGSVTQLHDESNMRRKSNNNGHNGGHNGGKNNGGQMQRRNNNNRFRPEQNTGKIKSASAARDKYLNLAREAMSQGDRIEAENFLQHADHYYRVLSALQEEDARNRPERHEPQNNQQDGASEQADAEVQEDAPVAEEQEEVVPLAAAS